MIVDREIFVLLVGSQPSDGPATEERVTLGWFNAVERLYALARQWADQQDQAESNTLTSDLVEHELHQSPPVYPLNAEYELTATSGATCTVYMRMES